MAPSRLRHGRSSTLLLALLHVACLPGAGAFLMSIDFGSQFFKVAVVAPGKPFEVVLNAHSKRKTPTAVSFHETVRTFGDDAIASAMKGAAKTPALFALQLGRNLTGVAEEQRRWLPQRFYPFSLGVNESGSLSFELDATGYSVEEVAAQVLAFAKSLASTYLEGAKPSDTVITVPSSAPYLQRIALLNAAEMAGLPRVELIHETAAAALQRALDLNLGGGTNNTVNESTTLFYNMGARHVEACIVQYRGATHAGKPTVSMRVLGCGVSDTLGGHQVDMTIAEKMLAAFQEKHPKLAEGIASSVRPLKKLEKEAAGLKHVLSANKDAQFRVESLYEDTDFMSPVSRETLEGWCQDLFSSFSSPIEAALDVANLTLEALDSVEMIGGGWRIPRIQALVSEYLQAGRPDLPPLNLSQHVNGDEAMATGAAFYGANSSAQFRTKKIFFSDSVPHSYAMVMAPLNTSQPHEEGWTRSVDLFPRGSSLRSRKSVKFNATWDVRASLLENGIVVGHWDLVGIHEAAMGAYANLSAPLVSLKVDLTGSGIVQISSALAVFDEPYYVPDVAAKAPDADANASTDGAAGGNGSAQEAGEAAPSSEGSEDARAAGSQADDAARQESGDQASEGQAAEDKTADGKDAEGKEAESKEAAAGAEGAATSGDEANATGTPMKRKTRKKKVTLGLALSTDGVHPRPLTADEKKQGKEHIEALAAADAEVKRIAVAKNGLESFVYEGREKLREDEACQKVSTEEDREAIISNLTAMEDWLYEEEAMSADANLLEAKLEELQSQVNPIRSRAMEMEQREQLTEIVDKVYDYVNKTLDFVEKNMTWVEAKEREGVVNLTDEFKEWYANVTEQQSTRPLTEEPAFLVNDAKRRLHRMQSEAQRLTKIQKIEPSPYGYGSGYGGAGGYGGYDDPKMRAYYDAMFRNFSRNGTGNYSDWWRNFSNFSGFGGNNDSDYMRSYYEYMARNFSSNSSEQAAGDNSSGSSGADEAGAAGSKEAAHEEL